MKIMLTNCVSVKAIGLTRLVKPVSFCDRIGGRGKKDDGSKS